MKQLANLSDAEYLVHLCMTPAPKTEAVQGKTPKQARKELARLGMSVAEWSRLHQVKQGATYEVLYGKHKGKRGEAHRIAVLLGIKDGVIAQASSQP